MLHDGHNVMCPESRPERSTIESKALLNRKGQRGNVHQPHFPGEWNPQVPAYGRFWIDVQSGGRRRKTVSLGRCATQSVARLLRYDETYRRGWCEKAGPGFELGELGYKSMAPIRPSLFA